VSDFNINIYFLHNLKKKYRAEDTVRLRRLCFQRRFWGEYNFKTTFSLIAYWLLISYLWTHTTDLL